VSPLAIMWAMSRDCFKYLKRSLFSVAEKH
jgi:hypothetical protein